MASLRLQRRRRPSRATASRVLLTRRLPSPRLERLETVQTALGPRAQSNFNSSLFNDVTLLKRIEAFEAKLGEPEKPKSADYTGNMFSRIANRRAAAVSK
jgi:hypothetical protein